ncbi:hypothetical protein V5799_020590 [Amblyomma americanum]|uniref:Cytochrome b5 heme-binding domain-containing protein n=1 Tax=Amblyomma americanum TaxID=6943 RepID=A0AAQ4ETE6_AMBAM
MSDRVKRKKRERYRRRLQRQEFKLGCNESRCVACPSKRKNKVRSQLPQGAKVDGRAQQQPLQQQQQQSTKGNADSMSTVNNSLSPGELNMSATGSGRVKVSLGPGRSLMDWIRLTHANPNLSGVNGRFLEVTYEELLKHNKKDDAWICLKGRVYNVTPYMEYHPGGVDELLRGVGKDATDLFNQTCIMRRGVHKWVNFESMLEKCLIGKIVGPAVQIRKCSQEHVWRFEQETDHWTNPCPQRNKVIRHQRQWHVHVAEVGIRMLWLSATLYFIVTQNFPASFPVPRIPFIKKLQRTDTTTSEDVPDINEETSPRPSVSYEWLQDDSTITVSIQSKSDAIIEQDKVVADLSGKELRIRVRLEKYFFIFHVELQENVYSSYNGKQCFDILNTISHSCN